VTFSSLSYSQVRIKPARGALKFDHIIPFPEGGVGREPPPPPSHAPDRNLHDRHGLPGKPVPEADSGGVTPPPGSGKAGGSMRFENLREGGLAGNPPSQK
jgi:hypothetical protein